MSDRIRIRVLDAVRAAQERGAHEVVLTGINLGSYRAADEGGDELALPGLLDLLLSETDVERIRLSSIEPPAVTDVHEVHGDEAVHGDRRVEKDVEEPSGDAAAGVLHDDEVPGAHQTTRLGKAHLIGERAGTIAALGHDVRVNLAVHGRRGRPRPTRVAEDVHL